MLEAFLDWHREVLVRKVSGGADSWELADGETVASLAGEYQRACEESRAWTADEEG